MILILIGPQGSGKGTQAKLLADKFNLTQVETGRLLRQEAQKTTRRAKLLDKFLDQGILIPDGIVINTVHDFLKEQSLDKGFVFDGHPRSLPQYQALKDYLKEHAQKIDLAFYLDLDDPTAVKRLSSRLNCSKCGKIYNKITNPPPQSDTCECGGQLFTRDDDQPAAVQTRLKLYHQTTEPLLKELQKDNILVKIDASQSIDQVFQQILDILPQKP